MKIRDKIVQDLKFIARLDKDLGISAACVYNTVIICCGLDRSAAGSANTDHAVSVLLRVIDLFGFFGQNLVKLAVHMMIEHILLFYGAECTESDMQRNLSDLYAFFADVLEQFLRKM